MYMIRFQLLAVKYWKS